MNQFLSKNWRVIAIMVFIGLLWELLVQPGLLNIIIVSSGLFFVAWRWGWSGVVASLIVVSSLTLPTFNFSRIPLFGDVLLNIPVEEKAVIFLLVLYAAAKISPGSRLGNWVWRGLPVWQMLVIAIMGYLTANYFALFPGESETDGYVKFIIYGLALFLLVYALAESPGRATLLLYALIGSGLLFSSAVFLAYFGFASFQQDVLDRLSGTWTLPFGIKVWNNAVYIGSYFALLTTIAWGFLLRDIARRKAKLLWFAIIMIFLFINVMTVSRTGLYGTVIGMVMMLALSFRSATRAERKRIIFLGGIFVLLIVVAGVGTFVSYIRGTSDPAALVDRIMHPVTGRGSTLQSRSAHFTISLGENLSHPMGIGISALGRISGYNEHNIYTLMLSAMGWFGTGAMIWLFYVCFKRSRWFGAKGAHKGQKFLWLANILKTSIVLMLILGMGHPIIGPRWGVTIFWTLLAIAASFAKYSLPKTKRRNGTKVFTRPPMGNISIQADRTFQNGVPKVSRQNGPA